MHLHSVGTRAAAAFTLLTLVVCGGDGPIPRFDRWVSAGAHTFALAHPLWRATMNVVTQGGSTTIIGPLAVVGGLALLAARRWRAAVFVAVALAGTLGIRVILVNAVHRARPEEQLAPAGGYAFPSGHTTASAAAALIVVMVGWSLLRRRWSRIVLAAGAGAWALAVGVSRVALVVHWPSDVLGAWLLVLTTVPGTAWLLDRASAARDARVGTAGRGGGGPEEQQ